MVDQDTLHGQAGEYRIYESIASGGFGSVFIGRDTGTNVPSPTYYGSGMSSDAAACSGGGTVRHASAAATSRWLGAWLSSR